MSAPYFCPNFKDKVLYVVQKLYDGATTNNASVAGDDDMSYLKIIRKDDIIGQDFATCIDVLSNIADGMTRSEDECQRSIGHYLFHFCSWANGFMGEIICDFCDNKEDEQPLEPPLS